MASSGENPNHPFPFPPQSTVQIPTVYGEKWKGGIWVLKRLYGLKVSKAERDKNKIETEARERDVKIEKERKRKRGENPDSLHPNSPDPFSPFC